MPRMSGGRCRRERVGRGIRTVSRRQVAERCLPLALAAALLAGCAATPPIRKAKAPAEGAGDGQAEPLAQRVERHPLSAVATDPRLRRARRALTDGDPNRALELLARMPPTNDPALAAAAGELRARSYRALGWLERSVLERIRLDRMLGDSSARRYNIHLLWRTLLALPPRQLATPPRADSATIRGWWSLAAIVTRDRDGPPGVLRADLAAWQRHYPNHPAVRAILPTLTPATGVAAGSVPATMRWPTLPPARIALLLPLSGALAPAAGAVEAGFSTALRHDGDAPAVIDLDTGSTPGGALDAYAEAVSDGADLVIGPLTREAVTALANRAPLGVPVLALNRPLEEAGLPLRMAVLDLSPDEGARAAASRAFADGRRRAAVIAAASARGERMTSAFRERFEALGGQVVAVRRYRAGSDRLASVVRDFIAGATPLWHDGRSGGRQRIDMLFLQGEPRDARLIRPLLRFYWAVNLPVYATGEVYADTAAPRRNLDLDGVVVCDLPAALAAAAAGKDYAGVRLRALGHDAYLLSDKLATLIRNPLSSIRGDTGRLYVDGSRRVTRTPACVPFRDGRPVFPVPHEEATR